MTYILIVNCDIIHLNLQLPAKANNLTSLFICDILSFSNTSSVNFRRSNVLLYRESEYFMIIKSPLIILLFFEKKKAFKFNRLICFKQKYPIISFFLHPIKSCQICIQRVFISLNI